MSFSVDSNVRSLNVFDRSALEEESTKRLLQLVEKKYRRKSDVFDVGETAPEEDTGEPHVDLLETIRRSMQQETEPGNGTSKHDGKSHAKKPRENKSRAESASGNGKLSQETKQELYEAAQKLDIPGRSQMSKAELIRAIRDARR
ncbi:MAG: Rho termination factor N-terminal domain-containing protein [Planctomycetaceae bacterium]